MQTLGEYIRAKRDEADLTLRELARQLGITPPFLSDIELGRRNPSESVLAKIADFFKVPVDQLKQFDHRESVADLKRYLAMKPEQGIAFRTVMDSVKQGKISMEDILKNIPPEQGEKGNG